MTPEQIVGALKSLIREERSALLTGQLAALEQLGQRKLQLLEHARTAGIKRDDPGWSDIREQNAGNGALIVAAQRGLQNARARLEQIRNGGAALKTYDRQGRSVEHRRTSNLVKKRA